MPVPPQMKWLRELTGATSYREIAVRLGRSHTTINRWAKDGIPPHTVLRLVVEHEVDVFDALEALGWMSPEERARIAPTIDHLPDAESLPTDALTAEVYRLSGVVHERVTEHKTGDDHARSEG